MRKYLRILGIDPGTATTGYGIIDLVSQNGYGYIGSGTIQTSKLLSPSARLKIIREDVLSLIELYTPDVVSIESIFFFKNAKTLVPVAQARGVIMEAAASRGLAIAEYTPMQVKMSISGYGRAEKKEIQYVVAKLLNQADIIKPDDACDAVAIAICHARNRIVEPCISSPSTPNFLQPDNTDSRKPGTSAGTRTDRATEATCSIPQINSVQAHMKI